MATIDCFSVPENPVERIRKVPMLGPVDSSIDWVGLLESQNEWPVAGTSSMAYWEPSVAPGTVRRLTVEPCWLTALGVGTPVQRVQ